MEKITLPRVKTGIGGFDEISNGGLVAGRPYVIIGAPGSGKTIFCTQFLMEGLKNHERGFYVSLEESNEELIQNMSVFGWDMQAIKILDTTQEVGSDKWVIRTDSVIAQPDFNLDNLIKVMWEKIRNYQPKRIVVDSLTSIKMLFDKDFEMRRGLLSFMNFLHKTDATTILTSTTESINLMEESLVSGVIRIHRLHQKGDVSTAIALEKMRGSDFDKHMRPYKITSEGVTVFPNENPFD